MVTRRHIGLNGKRRWRSGRRGFTLVELVIVGALIAIFSSLAIFGVQQQFRSNLRKAAIGESRQIAQSLDFANLDTSIFPRLCWLIESREGMDLNGVQIGNVLSFYSRSDIYGRFPNTGLGDVQTFGAGIREKWNGPYFALSQSRAGIAQGRGGFCYMIFPDLPSTGPNNPGDQLTGFRWPSDPYNSPYVVYMLDLDFSNPSPALRFVTQDATSFTRKGNYVNAVVSYGPNQYPGGVDEFDKPAFTGNGITASGGGVWDRRLYNGRPGFTDRGAVTFTYLSSAELSSTRGHSCAEAWSRDFDPAYASSVGGSGISDLGSDDIVFEF